PAVPIGDTLGAFDELRVEGKIAGWGLSNYGAAETREALAAGQPALLQNSFSLLDRGDEPEVIPLCASEGVAYQCFGPLAGGWLTGKYGRGASLPEGSRMTMRPEPYLRYDDEKVYAGLGALGAAAAEHGVSMAGLALGWL